MRWQSFACRLTVTRSSEALFIVAPQDRRPRTRCAYCGQVLRLDHPWWVVWPLTREEGFRTVVATIRSKERHGAQTVPIPGLGSIWELPTRPRRRGDAGVLSSDPKCMSMTRAMASPTVSGQVGDPL
jgi:hypothetical protein